jgi:hypothetical protein
MLLYILTTLFGIAFCFLCLFLLLEYNMEMALVHLKEYVFIMNWVFTKGKKILPLETSFKKSVKIQIKKYAPCRRPQSNNVYIQFHTEIRCFTSRMNDWVTKFRFLFMRWTRRGGGGILYMTKGKTRKTFLCLYVFFICELRTKPNFGKPM